MSEAQNKSIKKNYFYNLIYQIFLIVVPIFVTPYVSRILLSDGIGQFSYTSSIVSYFVLVSEFGFTVYGQRLIAQNMNDKTKLSICFFEIVFCRILTSTISLIAYSVLVASQCLGSNYTLLLLINSLSLLSSFFDISFLFYGCEEFKKITIRNLIFKILSIVSIFIFVKTHDDIWKYALIQVGFTFLGTLSFWILAKKLICKVKLNDIHPLKHFKPALLIFLPSIAVSIYTILDKTLIGLITKSDSAVGNYESAEKIVKLGITIISSLSTVYVSRNAALYKCGELDKLKKNMDFLVSFVNHIAIPLSLGLFIVSSNLMPWYLGTEYGENNIAEVILMMEVLCPITYLIGFSHVIGDTLEITTGNEKAYFISTTSAALLNIVLNIVFIKLLGAFGACISTVAAELLCLILHLIFNRNKGFISLKEIAKNAIKPLVSGGIMYGCCFAMRIFLPSSILNTFLIVLAGIVIYLLVLLLLRDSFLKNIIDYLKRKLKRKYN